MVKREVDIVVLSDIHLGTYGCHAKELLQYLKSIRPKTVILNGDIIDIWQFSRLTSLTIPLLLFTNSSPNMPAKPEYLFQPLRQIGHRAYLLLIKVNDLFMAIYK